MVSKDRCAPAGRRRPRRILLRLVLAGALALGSFLYVAFGLLPILARRGSLNRVVEDALQSLISVPVEIESVETDPLSEFSVTRISSVSSSAEDRFDFQAARVTAFYRPLDLILSHRLEELTVDRPSLFLNLDEDLSGLLRAGRTTGEGGGTFQVGRVRISDGRLAIRLGGRDLVLQDIDLTAGGIGGEGDLSFRIAVRGLGARLDAEGMLARQAGLPGAPPRYRIASARVDLEDLDLAALVPFLSAAGIEGAGRFSLSGTAEGTWPDRVEARLSSRLSDARVTPASGPRVRGGSGVLEVDAVALDGLREVEYHARLDTDVQVDEGEGGTRRAARGERLSARADGDLLLADPGGGARLRIEDASLEVSGLGAVKASGALTFQSPEPAFSLQVRAPAIALAKLEEHAVGETLRGILRGARGTLGLEVEASGTRSASRILARFDLADAALGAADRPFLTTSLSGRIEYRGRLGRPDAGAADGAPEGEADFEVARGSLAIPGKDLDVPAFSAAGSAGLSGDPAGGLGVRFGVRVQAREIGLGPVVETAEDLPIEAKGKVVLDGPQVRLDLDLRTPSLGAVSIHGTASRAGEGAPDLDLEARADSLPADRFLRTWLAEPFKEKFPVLDGARFSGRPVVQVRVAGRPPEVSVEGRFGASGLAAKLSGAELGGLDLELPFRLGARAGEAGGAVPGFLRIRRLTAGALSLAEVELPFELAGRAYRLPEKGVAVPLLGGELDLAQAQFSPSSPRERVRLRFVARELKLEEVTRALGMRTIPGRTTFDVRSLTMKGDRLDIDGRLVIDVFGGSLILQGLSIDHPFTSYRAIRLGSGSIHDFNLAALGEEFRFGLASGVLEGRVSNLELLGLDVVGFEAELATTPRPGVPQYLNKAAIESIQRIFAGPFGGIEEVFFSRFRYAGFGFAARVKDGGLRLRGKYDFGGVEYLMYSRWYQFPKVSIINTHPGIVYDWEAIKDNLRTISQRPEGSR